MTMDKIRQILVSRLWLPDGSIDQNLLQLVAYLGCRDHADDFWADLNEMIDKTSEGLRDTSEPLTVSRILENRAKIVDRILSECV